MFGVHITTGPSDWEIFQHQDGVASILMRGTFKVPDAAIIQGVASATPVFRVLIEEKHEIVIDWTPMSEVTMGENWSGCWNTEFRLKKGGLYLIETGLDTWSTSSNLHWIFRGDTRRHIGIGNLFIIAGQSNAAGYGRDSCLDPPMVGVHFFRNNDRWEIVSHPMNDGTDAFETCSNIEMGISGTSPYLSFGKEFYRLSQAPVGFVPTALGGSPMTRWVKGEKGDLYENLLDRLKHMGQPNGSYAGVLWYQGCSDATPEDAPHYLKRFETFIKNIRQDVQARLPIFTFQLNRELNSMNHHAWGKLRDTQRLASHILQDIYLLPTHDCLLCDGIHNDSSANVKLGERLAKQCAGVLLGHEGYYAPEPVKLKKTDEMQLTLTCAPCPFGLQLFDSPYKSNGFTIMEGEVVVDIISIEIDKHFPDRIHIYSKNQLSNQATLSYCWEANPTYRTIAERSNYLPIVSFYKLQIDDLKDDSISYTK